MGLTDSAGGHFHADAGRWGVHTLNLCLFLLWSLCSSKVKPIARVAQGASIQNSSCPTGSSSTGLLSSEGEMRTASGDRADAVKDLDVDVVCVT